MKLNFTWKNQTGQYQNGENLYINKICVASFSWNGTMSRDESEGYKNAHRYIGTILLPGFPSTTQFGASPEAIKATLEKMATNWFNEIEGGI